MGGAVARHAAEDAAFAHRQARFFVNFIGISDVIKGLIKATRVTVDSDTWEPSP
jgi:hypothetical protein